MGTAGADSSAASSSSDSVSSLNSQLQSHGWTKRPLNLEALSERDLGDVVAVFFELLGSSISNTENLEALSGRHRTLQYEFERTQKALAASQAVQRRAELETAGWRSRVAELERRVLIEEGKFREMREEASRGRKALEGVRIAAGHDAKKMQLKLDQANAKLVKLANDSSILTRSGRIVVLNPIQYSRSQPLAAGQDPLLEASLRDLAEIRQGLEEETEAFRHVVVSTANLLREAMAVASGSEAPQRLQHAQFFAASTSNRPSSSSHSVPSGSHPQIAYDRLQSLISTLRSKLEAKIIRIPVGDGAPLNPDEVEALARAEREREKEGQDLLDRVKDLEIEVECVRAREEEAKKSLDEYVKAQMQETMEKASERENDATDLIGILKEREKLEDERRKMVDAMGRLGKEKRVFERERQAFEEERRRVDVDDIIARLPSTPSGDCVASSSSQMGIASIPTPNLTESSSSSSSSIESPPTIDSYVLPALPAWTTHRPHSPSPLSPHTPRTPKAHIAKSKRGKTPLSRLVLEKAVRRKSQGLSADQISSAMAPHREALGEGSKRANAAPGVVRPEVLSKSIKGKEKAGSGAGGMGARDRLMASTRATEAKRLGVSTSAREGLGVSQRKSEGPASSGRGSDPAELRGKGKAVWR